MTAAIASNPTARLFFLYLLLLLAAILGQDVLLEPFGAEAFGMTVQATTRITSLWGTFVLIAILIAGALKDAFQNASSPNSATSARWRDLQSSS
jgi:BCD family chlorophyll transporter-like MFS transporter